MIRVPEKKRKQKNTRTVKINKRIWILLAISVQEVEIQAGYSLCCFWSCLFHSVQGHLHSLLWKRNMQGLGVNEHHIFRTHSSSQQMTKVCVRVCVYPHELQVHSVLLGYEGNLVLCQPLGQHQSAVPMQEVSPHLRSSVSVMAKKENNNTIQ